MPLSLEAMSFLVQDMTIHSTDPDEVLVGKSVWFIQRSWSDAEKSRILLALFFFEFRKLKIRDLACTDTHTHVYIYIYIQTNKQYKLNLINMQVLYMYFCTYTYSGRIFVGRLSRWRPWSRWRRQASCLPAPRSDPFRLNIPGGFKLVGWVDFGGAAVKKMRPAFV